MLFGVWVSSPWREDLERELGPVMAWVIPIVLAYIPGLVIGLMIATLLLSPYREMLDSARRAAPSERARRRGGRAEPAGEGLAPHG